MKSMKYHHKDMSLKSKILPVLISNLSEYFNFASISIKSNYAKIILLKNIKLIVCIQDTYNPSYKVNLQQNKGVTHFILCFKKNKHNTWFEMWWNGISENVNNKKEKDRILSIVIKKKIDTLVQKKKRVLKLFSVSE